MPDLIEDTEIAISDLLSLYLLVSLVLWTKDLLRSLDFWNSSSGSLTCSKTKEDASKYSGANKSAASGLEFNRTLLEENKKIDSFENEIKDLTEKLETIKIKRQEDQTKLKEAEKTKIQVQQLLEYKANIAEVQADLQRQVTQAKKEAKDAIEAKKQHAEEMSDLVEAMEIATLDKEEAEEKCEELQTELEQTKEKFEELKINYEIMKTEMSHKGGDGKATTYQVKQLEQQNERLKEALVKLRDLSAQEKQEQQRTQKEIDQQKSEINELSRAKKKISLLVDDYEKQLGELKEQVDAALGSEEMIDILTERNLSLEDRVKELQVIVDDLERLQDVNDQLYYSATQAKLKLCELLYLATATIREGKWKLEAMQEARKGSMIEEDSSSQSSGLESIKSATSSLEFNVALFQKDQEIDNFKNKIKDLTEELVETVKIKRQEDQTKLKEAEKRKMQIQQLLEYSAKTGEVQADLLRQVTQVKKEAKDAMEIKEQRGEEMFGLEEVKKMDTWKVDTLDTEMDKETEGYDRMKEWLKRYTEMNEEKSKTLQMKLEQIRNIGETAYIY